VINDLLEFVIAECFYSRLSKKSKSKIKDKLWLINILRYQALVTHHGFKDLISFFKTLVEKFNSFLQTLFPYFH